MTHSSFSFFLNPPSLWNQRAVSLWQLSVVVLRHLNNHSFSHVSCPYREFKKSTGVESVVVVWTATTERFCDVIVGLNDTKENLMRAVDRDEQEISPSTLYAIACIQEGVPFVNGSPQNTFVPGESLA